MTNMEWKAYQDKTRSGPLSSSRPLSSAFAFVMVRSIKLLFCAASFLLFSSLAASYEIPIQDKDYSRQICSGMWSDQHTFINGTRSLIDLCALLNSG